MGNNYNKPWKIYDLEKKSETIQIHVVGDPGCGKTSLINKYLYGTTENTQNNENEGLMLFDQKLKEIETDNHKLRLLIYDCKSSDDIRDKHLTHSHGTIICFSLDNPEGLRRIEEFWIPEIKKNYPKVPLLLVGTKRDLRDNARKLGNFIREVRGRILAQKQNLEDYIECSSETDNNVDAVFNTFISK